MCPKENSEIYASLPEGVARQLTLDRDPHGNVQVSLIETEKSIEDYRKAQELCDSHDEMCIRDRWRTEYPCIFIPFC